MASVVIGTAQDSNPPVCEESTTTNCTTEASLSLLLTPPDPIFTCVGVGLILPAVSNVVTTGQVTTATTFSDCSTTNISSDTISTTISNWMVVSGPAAGANGQLVVPTNCGGGTVVFHQTWSNASPCSSSGDATASVNYTVVGVASLTPSCGGQMLEWDDKDNDPETKLYLINQGDGYVTVTASPCPEVNESSLPGCWSFTGGEAIGSGKLQRRVERIPGKTVFTATAGTSKKTVTIIVYRAVFYLKADGAGGTLGVGHAWWELSLTPDAKAVMWGYRAAYIDEGGYWPDDWTVRPPFIVSGPGDVMLGDQGHPVEGIHWWEVTIDHFISGIDYLKALDQNPGTYDLYNANCTTIAIGNSMFQTGVPTNIWTPWYLRDYLNSLPPP